MDYNTIAGIILVTMFILIAGSFYTIGREAGIRKSRKGFNGISHVTITFEDGSDKYYIECKD